MCLQYLCNYMILIKKVKIFAIPYNTGDGKGNPPLDGPIGTPAAKGQTDSFEFVGLRSPSVTE